MEQTQRFLRSLSGPCPGVDSETVVISTRGDEDTVTPLDGLGGYGAFVRELNNALIDSRIDVSVNSLKDMPVLHQEGVSIAAVLPRGPVHDVILPCPLEELPPAAKVGTSSVRRAAMLRRIRPDLRAESIRGNVGTRLRKLDDGLYDAIILAEAGLDRLGIDRDRQRLPLEDFLPAPGQGAIAIACRSGDDETAGALEKINHGRTWREVMTERLLMEMLGADCSAPVGILASEEGGAIRLRAMNFPEEGRCVYRDETVDHGDQAALRRLAGTLKGAGA